MKDMDGLLLATAQESYEALLAKFVACEAALECSKVGAKEEWVKWCMLMAGEKWTDPPPSYEDACKVREDRHTPR